MTLWGDSTWGHWLTPDGRRLVMRRRVQRVRFFDVATGEQVGPEHANVYPAVVAAYHAGYVDPTKPAAWSAACTAEVRANSRPIRKRAGR